VTRLWRIVRPSLAGRERPEGYGQPEATGTHPVAIQWPTNEPLALGDFTWPAGTYLPLVAEPFARELAERFGGTELGRVEVVEHRVRASDGKPGARLPRGFLDRAQQLVELRVERRCSPDPRSTIREIRPARPAVLHWGGGGPAYDALLKGDGGLAVLEGVEWWESGAWDPAAKALAKIHHPREPGRGLFVAGDADLFRLDGENRFVLCSDAVKELLEERGATNVAFLEAGQIVRSASTSG